MADEEVTSDVGLSDAAGLELSLELTDSLVLVDAQVIDLSLEASDLLTITDQSTRFVEAWLPTGQTGFAVATALRQAQAQAAIGVAGTAENSLRYVVASLPVGLGGGAGIAAIRPVLASQPVGALGYSENTALRQILARGQTGAAGRASALHLITGTAQLVFTAASAVPTTQAPLFATSALAFSAAGTKLRATVPIATTASLSFGSPIAVLSVTESENLSGLSTLAFGITASLATPTVVTLAANAPLVFGAHSKLALAALENFEDETFLYTLWAPWSNPDGTYDPPVYDIYPFNRVTDRVSSGEYSFSGYPPAEYQDTAVSFRITVPEGGAVFTVDFLQRSPYGIGFFEGWLKRADASWVESGPSITIFWADGDYTYTWHPVTGFTYHFFEWYNTIYNPVTGQWEPDPSGATHWNDFITAQQPLQVGNYVAYFYASDDGRFEPDSTDLAYGITDVHNRSWLDNMGLLVLSQNSIPTASSSLSTTASATLSVATNLSASSSLSFTTTASAQTPSIVRFTGTASLTFGRSTRLATRVKLTVTTVINTRPFISFSTAGSYLHSKERIASWTAELSQAATIDFNVTAYLSTNVITVPPDASVTTRKLRRVSPTWPAPVLDSQGVPV